MVSERIFSVVVLNCGYTCPSIQQQRGQYDDIFRSLLQPAVGRLYAKDTESSKLGLNIQGYDTVNQIYPPTLEGIDGIIISGSPNGAYQDLAWIQKLCRYVSCKLTRAFSREFARILTNI